MHPKRVALAPAIGLLLLLLASAASGAVGWANCTAQFPSTTFRPWGPAEAIPLCKEGHLALFWDPATQNPQWAAYHVTPEDTDRTISGRLDFHEDADLLSLGVRQPAVGCDAFNVTWNRGHLAPNHVMSYSDSAKHSTFTMANVAPQYYYWNQHAWMYFEMDVYDWIKGDLVTGAAAARDAKTGKLRRDERGHRVPAVGDQHQSAHRPNNASNSVATLRGRGDNSGAASPVGRRALFLLTGVAYTDRARPAFSYDDVAVPDYFWTVLCEPSSGNAVGVYGPNVPYSEGTETYRTVAEVERLFGGPLLPPSGPCDASRVDADFWRFFE